ncbi:hypothetical protein B0H19DRAFT_1348769 [Mycena capillaripes]|nr:hypothetical protein B0H19DRAFT_1348769 [Mycena capillaripes]
MGSICRGSCRVPSAVAGISIIVRRGQVDDFWGGAGHILLRSRRRGLGALGYAMRQPRQTPGAPKNIDAMLPGLNSFASSILQLPPTTFARSPGLMVLGSHFEPTFRPSAVAGLPPVHQGVEVQAGPDVSRLPYEGRKSTRVWESMERVSTGENRGDVRSSGLGSVFKKMKPVVPVASQRWRRDAAPAWRASTRGQQDWALRGSRVARKMEILYAGPPMVPVDIRWECATVEMRYAPRRGSDGGELEERGMRTHLKGVFCKRVSQ